MVKEVSLFGYCQEEVQRSGGGQQSGFVSLSLGKNINVFSLIVKLT